MATNDAGHYGLGEPLMLEKIDKLFACGVGLLVDLPQIVVVGDQSSGKSSVLEGLIKKPLPRDSGLCTRFATQIIFRRAEEERISVSIIPDRHASTKHAANVKAWTKDDLKELDAQTFSDIMVEVHEVMGLSTSEDDLEGKPTFSNDVLCLEISGPDQEHLSVIDVPGIFKSTTPGLTTKEDIALVRAMVEGFMANPRSVMLAVVPANVDIATQEILQMAEDVDPEGHRTLGVLTKPDLVDKGAENKVIDLMEGRAKAMKLGWQLVRNPGQQDLDNCALDRNALEMQFFRTQAPWSNIAEEKVGVEALRGRLKEVLSPLVKREFPKVTREILKRLTGAQKRLRDIGPERDGQAAQTAFLTEIAAEFQRFVTLGLGANYGSDDKFEKFSELRIASYAMTRMNVFAVDMSTFGHTYGFTKLHKESQGEDVDDNDGRAIRREYDLDELIDVLHPQKKVPDQQKGDIHSWLSGVCELNRGFELGTFNSSILATAMKKQSAKWEDIALGFVSDMIVATHAFVTKALESTCADEDVRQALIDALSQGLIKKYQKAIDHAKFLLDVESAGTPMTFNHYFNNNLQKRRQEKMLEALRHDSFVDPTLGEVVRIDKVKHTQNMSNAEHAVKEIHDILDAYYKVTRKTFVDCVCKHAADHFLLNGPDSPLRYFSPVFVSRLATEQLESIAGEAPAKKRQRSQLKREISSLAEAKKILSTS